MATVLSITIPAGTDTTVINAICVDAGVPASAANAKAAVIAKLEGWVSGLVAQQAAQAAAAAAGQVTGFS